jgi:hypothetical protein
MKEDPRRADDGNARGNELILRGRSGGEKAADPRVFRGLLRMRHRSVSVFPLPATFCRNTCEQFSAA